MYTKEERFILKLFKEAGGVETGNANRKKVKGKRIIIFLTSLLIITAASFTFLNQSLVQSKPDYDYATITKKAEKVGAHADVWSSKTETKEMKFIEDRKDASKEASYFPDQDTAIREMNKHWALFPNTASPGDVILVRHDSPGTINWQDKEYTLTSFGAGYYTYLPIPMGIEAGTYDIGTQQLTIKDKTFKKSYITVSEENQNIRRNTERIMADQKIIDKARSQSADEFLFSPDSEFMTPVEGERTTPFGYTRYVNGEYSGSHTAIDWAAPTGTPIRATNDGVVALSENFYLTGKSVYIDHGMDLFSQYIHMSELKVEAGEKVEKGDIIGLVGSTGFSTGPHLHFTFWVHNVPSNPDMYLGKTPFQLVDEKE